MKKKKILYIITKSNWGGAQRYVYDLAKNISSKPNTEVIVAHGGQGALKQKLKDLGIRTIEIKHLNRDVDIFNDWKVFKELIEIFKKERPDAIHLNSSKIGGLGALAGRIAGIEKIIFTAHGWSFNEDRNLFFKITTWLLSWITIILSHKTIVICEHDKKQALLMPFISYKIKLIYNGIEEIDDLKNKDESRQFLFNKIGVKNTDLDKKMWIGTISELHKNKGLKYAILAFKKKLLSNKAILVIIGEGEERSDLEEIIKENDLEEKVFLIGHIDEASQYLKAFDIFTLTSLKEGLPYALLEAGTTSLPVVASRTGGTPEIVENMRSGIIIEPKNIDEIFDSLKFLIENKKQREGFGEELNKRIKSKFSLSKMIEKTFDLYS